MADESSGFQLENVLPAEWSEQVRCLEVASQEANLNVKQEEKIIAVADQLQPAEVVGVSLNHPINHVVQKTNPMLKEEINSSALMLVNARTFLDYSISSILSPHEAGPVREKELMHLEFTFNSANEKRRILNEASEFLSKLPRSGTFLTDACLIIDELFTNAVFNAPFVDDENTSSGISRVGKGTPFRDGKFGRIFLSADSKRLVIGCSDPFGKLNIRSLLKRIHTCYENGFGESISFDSGGAGIGSSMVFDACSSFYAAVEKNVQTTVCCVLAIDSGRKKRSLTPKHIHILECP